MAEPHDEADDLTVQAVVLEFLIGQPQQISMHELLLELAEPTHGPHDRDTVERAARDLVHAGLLHRSGDFVFPTRAARHYQQLPYR